MMQHEAVNWQNISASQTFDLVLGGKYLFVGSATFNSGSLEIQALSQDGSTYVPLVAAFNNAGTEADLDIGKLSANGAKVLTLPPGSYKLVVTAATAVYASVARCPTA